MILTVDVGNTQTQIGLFDCNSKTPERVWLVKTDKDITADGLYVALSLLKEAEKLDFCNVHLVTIACVVPGLIPVWRDCVDRVSNIQSRKIAFEILDANSASKLGPKYFDCKYAFPHEVGPDIIAASIAAKTLYPYPSVTVDFGTATNFNVINKDGEFLGGLIAPGLNPSLKALVGQASALPDIEIKKPCNVIGYDTIESIQSGIVLGEASKVDGLIKKIEEELNCEVNVIITGGWAELLSECMKAKSEYSPFLILQGLKIFADNIDKL